MKKKIIIIIIIISAFLINTNLVKAKFVGTCYCWSYTRGSTETIECSEIETGESTQEDFPDGFCHEKCWGITGGGIWFGSIDDSAKKDIQSRIDQKNKEKGTNEVITDDYIDDCTYVEKESDPDTQKNCTYKYTKEACNSLGSNRAQWNEETGCCDLKRVCWFHLKTGFEMDGGDLSFQEESPCTEESKKKNPNEKCRIVDLSEDACHGTNYTYNIENEDLEDWVINVDDRELLFRDKDWKCEDVVGPVLKKIIRASFTIFQIVGAIIAIVKGMIELIPAIVAKDASALKKASKHLVTIAIILAVIILLGPICKFIGQVLGFDISCLVD